MTAPLTISKTHVMSEEVDPPTAEDPNPESHRFCTNCLLCDCHEAKRLQAKCQWVGGVFSG